MEYQFESAGPALRIVVLVFLIAAVLAAMGLVVVLAALPGRVAKARKHPQSAAINVCGWLGLPSGILWVLAMVWAYLDSSSELSKGSQHESLHDLRNLREQVVALEKALAELESTQTKESP